MIRGAAKAKVLTASAETLTRSEAICRLRCALNRYTDSETSLCKAAGEKGFFCNGFRRYGDDELRQRYSWVVAKRPNITRAELEEVANEWQLAQQEVHELPIACDVQQKVQGTCRGWSEFSNEQLARFYFQMTGREVLIV